MKLKEVLLVCITCLSVIAGYLISKASLVGRAGMSVFYREYNFLKVWWKGAIVIFILLMVFFLLQGLVQRRMQRPRTIQILLLAFAAVGLYFTYNNFRHDLSYRLMGERFHLGFYLFWISWMLISLYYLTFRDEGPTVFKQEKDTASSDGSGN